jgi:hypothetical protein
MWRAGRSYSPELRHNSMNLGNLRARIIRTFPELAGAECVPRYLISTDAGLAQITPEELATEGVHVLYDIPVAF